MGGTQSKPDNHPVQGLPEENPLTIIPLFRTSLRESYTVNKKTVLKLKKNSILTVESNILDTRGFYVFRKSGGFVSCALEFRDDAGNLLASTEKKTRCSESVAWIKLENEQVVATLVHRYRGRKSKALIYIHEEPFSEEMETPPRRKPDIKASGDFGAHEYQFRMDGIKVAAVQTNPEPQMYSLEIGPNTDIAFIAICTAMLDLLHLRATLTPLDLCSCCLGSDSDLEYEPSILEDSE